MRFNYLSNVVKYIVWFGVSFQVVCLSISETHLLIDNALVFPSNVIFLSIHVSNYAHIIAEI